MTKLCLAALIASAALAQAQGPPPGRDGGPRGPMRGMMGLEGGHPGHVVAGAPFSAQEVTTDTQTLANGTHITNKVTSQFYRDAQGRTRMERTFSGVGPWAGGTPQTMITIFDPVGGYAYELNPAKQTATKITLPPAPTAASTAVKTPREPRAGETVVKTDLGTQTIQGLSCTGTRNTITIATGTMGNDQPIVITEERWYSADLQTVIQSKRVDPRHGEVEYTVQNINRSAPDASLFAPPAGFTVTARAAESHMRGPRGPQQ